MNYAYDFNYSIQLDTMPKPSTQLEPSKQLFTNAACSLIQTSIFANHQLQQFVELLVKQPLFIKIGTLTCQLGQILLGFMPKSIEMTDKLDSLREQLCECSQELNVILGRQKDYYLNISILVLSLIQAKVLWQKHSKKIERTELFHLLHWEIKGYHSTNVVFQSIQSESLIKSKLKQYLEQRKTQVKVDLSTSLSFGDISRSMNLQKAKTSRFQMAMNKQNHNSNVLRENIMSFKKEKARRV